MDHLNDLDNLDGWRWDGCDRTLRDHAMRTFAATGEVSPCFVAFDGERPLLLADLRPFPKGGYAEPLIEVAALAAPLGADRMAVALGARAWSLDDPVPPVTEEADLRQRVVAVHGADAVGGTTRAFGTIWPFTVDGPSVAWDEPLRTDEAEGWIPAALATLVEAGPRMPATESDMARQAARCEHLGHRLILAPPVEDRLAAVQ